MFNPVSTYRVQFHNDFRFDDLEEIIPYLEELGVGAIYASPVFEAAHGSVHGYDCINPLRINPELGTLDQLRRISGRLKKSGIGWIQDIVPNHMAFHTDNAWLLDVLEKGEHSAYASFFDIDWSSPVYEGRLMVPFLGGQLEDAIAAGELKLVEEDGFFLQYHDQQYPLNERSQDILRELCQAEHADTRSCLESINTNKALVRQIAEQQFYRLCHWQETDERINYRRFFTVNGLISLNVQDQQVFDQMHSFIKDLLEEGIFQGLRVDHIDGLYEPTTYLERLRVLAGGQCYIIVEKILQQDETQPGHWPVQGNTGYDFLAMVNNILTNKKAEKHFTEFYRSVANEDRPELRLLHEKKARILFNHMGGELDNLCRLFETSGLAVTEDIHPDLLRKAIAEFVISCPVYRYYAGTFPLPKKEAEAVKKLLESIEKNNDDLQPAIELLAAALLKNPHKADGSYAQHAAHFYKRCMQLSGPLMAKGLEDTLMYTYNRFIAHNEVGDTPVSFGLTVDEFHKKMQLRQKHWPLSMNTTATHDTKRGEDVRARLQVLTGVKQDWFKTVRRWQRMNAGIKRNGAPDNNDEYFIYQTLAGTYPIDNDGSTGLEERLATYMQKALREAKIHSDWTKPDPAYESATFDFITTLCDQKRLFWTSLQQLHQRIADAGIVNSLSQVLLKCTCPGIPDIYQGCELWDQSLVDPDNRRKVDYEKRKRLVQGREQGSAGALPVELWSDRNSGRIKIWLLRTLLKLRKEDKEAFENGEYIPLRTRGKHKDNILAFARHYRQRWYVVVTSLHIEQLYGGTGIDNVDWKDTAIILPPEAPREFRNLLNNSKGTGREIRIKDIFQDLPLAILMLQQPYNERGAGLLLAISSLPAPFGIGDLGPAAYAFAGFLSRSKQKYWQLLPLNPTERGAGHSPYSSYSAMAGNPLLISPELLAEDGLLEKDLLKEYELPVKSNADYKAAEEVRERLFDIAYNHFSRGDFSMLRMEFERFCRQEADWLDDLAIYSLLKRHHQGRPWYEWEPVYKDRDRSELDHFALAHSEPILKVKWLQFVFLRQWKALKRHVNNLGIHFFGDMPFYVSYDSADVWANRDLFCLDTSGKMTGVAGVPPDYFSADGQLWGMPTFNWNVLKERDYDWWMKRLRKNLELFDLLRLDHFRAFREYWQVPAGMDTARNGEWLEGPGADFFKTARRLLGGLPFVAEDLGDKMEEVYRLRDEIGLPGMRVLQFAFGEQLPRSVDIPHNYSRNCIVYTGTHDNNTTVGWYKEDTNKADHERMHHYIGPGVKKKNIHRVLARMAYGSVARVAVLPVQDVLGLDETARMNIPGSRDGNWTWRLEKGQLNADAEARLRGWTETFNRE